MGNSVGKAGDLCATCRPSTGLSRKKAEHRDASDILYEVNAFNAARVIDIDTLTSDLATEAVTARSAELGNADGIAAQNLNMLATVDAETVRAQAAEVANADAIAALGVTDASTLASINTMLADYQGADNTISGLITALTTHVATLEGIVASLTA